MTKEDAISRATAIKSMEDLEQEDIERYGCPIPEGFDSRRAVEVLESLPSIFPKTGHWKPYLKEGLRYQCSVCDSRFDTPWEYCPHCGAKMEKAL